MPKKSKTESSTKSSTAKSTPQKPEEILKDLSKFDMTRVAFKYVDVDNKEATQINCYPKYLYKGEAGTKIAREGENIIIASGPIKMTKGGIPKTDGKYRKTDADRMFFWLPFDPEQKACVELFNVFRAFDKYMNKEINDNDNKKGVLAKLINGKEKPITGLKYIDSVKPSPTREDDEDDDPNKKKYEPYDRLKVRFSTLYDSDLGPNDPKEINTFLFVGNNNEPLVATSPSEFEKHFYWNCTAQFALMFSKIWIQKSGDKKCGLTVKCIQLAVTEQPERKQNMLEQFKTSIFASNGAQASKKSDSESDSESEDSSSEGSKKSGGKSKDVSSTVSSTQASNKGKKEPKEVAVVKETNKEKEKPKGDSDDDEDEDDSDKSDEEDSDEEDSDEEDSDENVKPSKNNSKTKEASVKVKGKVSDGKKQKKN